MNYVFKDAPVTILNAKRADPNRIGAALAKIAEDGHGRLTPNAVVEAARNPRSPLHRHFEWDDAKAAEAYRLDQAREIIRVVRIEGNDNEEPVRAFLSVKDAAGVSYRTAEDVQGSLELQLAVLRQAEADLEAWTKRYRELSEICDDVLKARDKIRTRREAAESRLHA
jgi:hypothetical protein